MPSARPALTFLIDPASPHRVTLPQRERTSHGGAGPVFPVVLLILLAILLAAGGTGLADICEQAGGIACGP